MVVLSVSITRMRSRAEEQRLMAEEVCEGLRLPLPSLPSKYFYDDVGSRLFDAITELPEYYPTRTEEAILEATSEAIIRRTRPREIVELGSGFGRKIRLLVDAAMRRGGLDRCAFLEVNEAALVDSLGRLAQSYPGIEASGIVGDFTRDLAALGPGGGRLALFLAGTIGNLHPDAVPPFLKAMAAQLAPGDHFLVGVDLVKDVARLEAAYNDAAGVTAEFNLNILRVVNASLCADFDPDAFEHVAFYDRRNAWIEMRLRAKHPSRARVPACGLDLRFGRGDEIRTELSCKYTRESFEHSLAGTGLALADWLTDSDRLFALALLRRG
jgi:L-histidine N-alpha-methyltransferase